MRSLWLDEDLDLAWREVPDAELVDATDVIVAPLAVARCDLDLSIALGLYPMPLPLAMGHEMAGEIVEVGDEVERWSVGDRVIVPFQVSCGRCDTCRDGHTNACTSVPVGSAYGFGPHGDLDVGGSLTERVRVPFADELLIAVPDGLDPVAAAGIPDNVSDGYRTVAGPMRDRPDSPVLVVGGAGQSVGLYAVAAAVALGAPAVLFLDHDDERLRCAERLGAEVFDVRSVDDPKQVRAVTKPFGAAITVDASGTDDGRTLALTSARPCGHCTSVIGGAGGTDVLPLQTMYVKGMTYDISRVHARATAPEVLELVSDGRLDPLAITHRVVDVDDAVEAMTAPDIKIIFRC
ncbi:MAG: alcohol dehydrogenase catalytic domain-containing protein [Actinomycetota bacterium]